MYCEVGRSLFLLGRHKLALEAYLQAKEKNEKADWEVHHNLGVCHMYTREFEEAKEQLKLAIEYNKHEQTYIVLGKVFLMMSDVQGAIEVYKMAVQ